MKRAYLIILQKICRLLVNYPHTHYYGMRMSQYFRNYFSKIEPAIVVKTKYDNEIKIIANLQSHIDAQIFWQGYQEADRGEIILMKKLLNPGSIFIDVGANIGVFSLVAASIAKHGEIHAFEPSKRLFSKLNENITLNGFTNIKTNNQGLFNEAIDKTLHHPTGKGMVNAGAASLFPENQSEADNLEIENISLITFDSYVDKHKFTKIDLIKMDIEGAEMDALQGAVDSLIRFKPQILMELDESCIQRAGYSFKEILDFWHKLNYEINYINFDGSYIKIDSLNQLKKHQNIYCRQVVTL
jgi:FkbM family methyltransferase